MKTKSFIKIKWIAVIIMDMVLIIAGFTLSLIGFIKWGNIGYQFETWSTGGTFEGRSVFFTVFLGIALFLYGLFDYLVFRRKHRKAE
jgi:uncharacterized membrane protein